MFSPEKMTMWLIVYLVSIDPYRKYINDFIINLIGTIQNVTLNCAEAACMLRMPERTAQDCFARFRNGEEYLPSRRNKKSQRS